ncbi:oligosaccharide repeat unit polymerase [Vibrio diabolicus]|uniref:oligosaccharide repeat unit polymerase n=1 Tax=Vibrio diabolicus TaxID=50719 RepID=UPI00211B087B|nr:oligosaccharide repeat unit polymerase [Vibrio diabolicus]MCG6223060.1 oligosaccharide repeat unit polymerase [Vibrio diabolicus]
MEKIIVISVYLFSYLFCTLYYLSIGYVEGDLRGVYLEHPNVLIFSFFQATLSLILFAYFSAVISSKLKVKSIKISEDDFFHKFLLLLNVSFFIFSYSYNFGFSSGNVSQSIPKVPLYFFILFQPLYLSYIYFAVFIKSKSNLYLVNIFLVVIFSVYKGWLGPINYVLFLSFIKYKEYILHHKLRFLFISFFFILLVPFIKISKVIFMVLNQKDLDSVSEAINDVLFYSTHDNIYDLLIEYFVKTFERFDHVAILYYFNSKDYSLIYNDEEIASFFQEGWINERLHSVFSNVNSVYIQEFFANKIQSAYSWNVQVPLDARFSFDLYSIPYLSLYVITLLTLTIFLSKLITERKELISLNWFIAIGLLFHGWFYSYVLWIQALVVFFFIYICKKFLSHVTR